MRVGPDFYMTHSSQKFAPTLLVWHSTDLVNWQPVTRALRTYLGDVWAPDLSFHDGRFFILADLPR